MLDFSIGDKEVLTRKITEKDVNYFSEVIGDYNPIHTDMDFARDTFFGKRIVHGMFLGGLISSLLGNKIPGPGAIYMSQEMKFLAPVFLDDEVTVIVEVVDWNSETGKIRLSTEVFNQNNKKVVSGEAKLILSSYL